MTKKNLIPLTIAALAIVAVSMPADAKGWGNGNIPPGIAKKLYGYAGNNGGGSSFFGNSNGFGGGNGFFGNANGFGGNGFGGGGCGGGMGGNFQNGFGRHNNKHHHWQNNFGNNNWGNNNWGNNNWGNHNWGNHNWGNINGGNGWNNNGTGPNNLSWLSNRLTNRQQRLQSLLSNGDLPADRAARIQNELTQIQNAQGSITAGNFNPRNFGGLRGLFGF